MAEHTIAEFIVAQYSDPSYYLCDERSADRSDADTHDRGHPGNVDHEGEVSGGEADDKLLDDHPRDCYETLMEML